MNWNMMAFNEVVNLKCNILKLDKYNFQRFFDMLCFSDGGYIAT